MLYGLMNIISASGIVFANKAVFSHYNYNFTFALTWIHTLFTLVGMRVFANCGMFTPKPLPQSKLVPLAVGFVSYIVLCNLSLKINTVGFYQVMKIAVAPTVLLLELIMFGKIPGSKVTASVMLVCLGIGVATVSDSQIIRNLTGVVVGIGATVMTALYQIWAGTKQKELQAGSNQLLHAYTPQAALLLGLMVPFFEPMGWDAAHRTPDTLLGYHYTTAAVLAILFSAVLGLMVSLSTFLVIGATSSLTYNVVGHLKTVIILSGGCAFFGDAMPPKKLFGVAIAMVGIIWYTQLKLVQGSEAGGGGSKDGPYAASSSSSSSLQQQQPTGAARSRENRRVTLSNMTVKSAYTAGLTSSRRAGGSFTTSSGSNV